MKLKSFVQSRITLGIICFILGASSVIIFDKVNSRKKMKIRENDPLAQFFGSEEDPFAMIRKMRKNLRNEDSDSDPFGLKDEEDQLGLGFDQAFSNHSLADLKKKEDSHFVYYEIPIQGLKQEKLDVKVDQGQILISGQIEKKVEESDGNSYYHSTFHRSFPVPENGNANQVQVEQEKDKIILKFPKSA